MINVTKELKIKVDQTVPTTKVVSSMLDGKSAYRLALDSGFVGSIDDWLKSLQGKDAYRLALDEGFVGSYEEWVETWSVPQPSESDAFKILQTNGSEKFWVSLMDIQINQDQNINDYINSLINSRIGGELMNTLEEIYVPKNKLGDLTREELEESPPNLDYGNL